MKCTTQLSRSLDSELLIGIYSKENAPKLCQMVYVGIEVAKLEKMRALRRVTFIAL